MSEFVSPSCPAPPAPPSCHAQVNDTEMSSQALAKAALLLGSTSPLIQLTVLRPKGSDEESEWRLTQGGGGGGIALAMCCVAQRIQPD